MCGIRPGHHLELGLFRIVPALCGPAVACGIGELDTVKAGDGGADPGGDLSVDSHQVLGLGTDVSGQRLGMELTGGACRRR